ncbi:MAG: NUDIX hydrolase [Bullifex sp.]
MMTKNDFPTSPCTDVNHLFWASEKPQKAYHCPIFDVYEVVRQSQDGKTGKFMTVSCRDWVVIVPVFKDEDGVIRVIVEQQYRHGSDSVTREFPAGLVEKDENALDAAVRELLEETGLTAGKVSLLGNLSPNNAFMSNRQYFFLAEELEKVSGQDLDPNEEIDLFALPLDEVLDEMGTGLSDNALMTAAAALVMKEEKKRGGKLL